ncbi:hydrogenase nickel insertion protein HypA [Methanococcus vannielii SB]|jgi:hydrogenase nickel incorporation protein HypA/HybF|uniref:Hydrogenase maturation factor HypA n=1 Tax=Methanococcus vannielii (strain ATCC 35089 / DSM 1224 / JCM 13029 / OCM 148 / SB) TaxID=406327 RepID=HYPA_METVS|nr:hydrogenase maturation nickel metallochaperone HypA [Methanococcus vannielii]A6URT7.1 RecName: Full=Hydrogenase maturation factor HypA [Methanococcus vannielii SB]ABR55209.1 hydrogenase nickel insertion protein HypA [Methanococcus vannielii SB]
MHELSYATSILNSILEVLKEQESLGKKVTGVSEINLEIGDLTLISFEQLKFAFEVIAENTLCKNAVLNTEMIKPKISCLNCGFLGILEVTDELEAKCPKCGSMNVRIKGGKEFNIKNAIIEFDD